MDIPYKLELLAQAKFRAWNDYCDAGEDKPSWNEWLEQMKAILARRPQKTKVSLAVSGVYGR